MARIELSNIGGGGTTLSLTTTGASGAATLAGSVLNIPVYQGQLTLTTTGTSGAATLAGDILNIPNYATGSPAGAAGQVQFNSTPAGSFAASANLVWDDTATQLNIGTPLSPTGRLNVRGGGTLTTVNARLTNSGNTELLKVLDNGNTNIGTGFNWDNVNNRLGIGTASPAQLLHVAGATRIDGTNAIIDNRNNSFLTQSASTTTSNRESVWGNGGYAKLRAHTKGFYVGASFPAGVNYLFYVDGGTATGILDREGIYLRPTQPAAGGNTNGGDVIIELPAGTGTGRRGEVLIGTATATGPSAIVEISSTNQGLLLPRMTGAQAEAIPTPADGLLVYANNGNGAVITSVGFWGYSAGAWSKLN